MRTLVLSVFIAVVTALPGAAAGAVVPAASASVVKPECRRTLPAYPEIQPGTTSRATRTLFSQDGCNEYAS